MIVDINKIILYSYCGETASVHDSRAFKKTKIYRNPKKYFSKDEYVLADSAYELSTTIITPYRNPAAMQRLNRKFNYYISKERIVVEHVNGILKQRFQSLSGLRIAMQNKDQHKLAVMWFEACCTIHNILQNIDPWEYEDVQNTLREGESYRQSNDAEEKRQLLKRDVLLFNNIC